MKSLLSGGARKVTQNWQTTARREINSRQGKTGYAIFNNNVIRDSSQGDYANRIPLPNSDVLQVFKLNDEIQKIQLATGSIFNFDSIEVGGAQVQVDENFLGQDYTETHRQVGAAAPNSPVRPLWRGKNSFLLSPAAKEDLQHILTQLALDLAQRPGGLRPKIFDSQAVLSEYVQTLQIIKQLLNNKAFNITPEIAIPHSDGTIWTQMGKNNPYPREFFLNKLLDAQAIAADVGFNPDDVLVSFKNMIGNTNESETYELTGAAMEGQKKKGYKPRVAWHIHGDQERSLRALVGATRAAKEQNGEIYLDTIPGHSGGFTNTLHFINTLIAENLIDTSAFGAEALKLLEKQDVLYNKVMHEYRAAKAPEIFTEDDYINYEIARGAGLSLMNAVRGMNIAGGDSSKTLPVRLGLSAADTCHVVGKAMITFSEIAGHPLPVTPGMQNKQIAALHIVEQMNKLGYFAGMSGNRKAIEVRIRKPLENAEIKEVFSDLNHVVANFLRGEMPAVKHPVVSEMFPQGKTEEHKPKLPEAEKTVDKLIEDGFLFPKDRHSSVARAIILGGAAFNTITRNKDEQIGKEIPANYFDSREEFEAAKKTLGAGKKAIQTIKRKKNLLSPEEDLPVQKSGESDSKFTERQLAHPNFLSNLYLKQHLLSGSVAPLDESFSFAAKITAESGVKERL